MSAVAGSPPEQRNWRERMWARFRLTLEFAFLFLATVTAKELLASSVGVSYPNLLWLPVAVLTVQNGLACALAAALVATALQYAGGLPPELLGEDIYSYIGRVGTEPIAWTCFALIFGHIRSRQIAHAAELEARLAERNAQCAAVAELCDDLRGRIEVLERQIAASAQSSNTDMAESIIELHRATWDDFADRLRRFVVLMTGCPDFVIHLLRADVLIPALPAQDNHRPGSAGPITGGDALFEAIVKERRSLWAGKAADAATLPAGAVMAGPIAAGPSAQSVIGMFSIGGALPQDCCEDIERRFSLALSEISRLSNQLMLVERWQASAAGISNGGGSAGEAHIELPPCETDEPLKAALAEPARQVALQ